MVTHALTWERGRYTLCGRTKRKPLQIVTQGNFPTCKSCLKSIESAEREEAEARAEEEALARAEEEAVRSVTHALAWERGRYTLCGRTKRKALQIATQGDPPTCKNCLKSIGAQAEEAAYNWDSDDMYGGERPPSLDRNPARLEFEARQGAEEHTRTEPRSQKQPRRDVADVASSADKKPTSQTVGKSTATKIKDLQRRALADRDGARCLACGVAAPTAYDGRVRLNFLQVDHKLPKTDGGSDDLMNLCLLCPPCNSKKGPHYTITGLRNVLKREGIIARK